MSTTTYYTATSLDGYIADEHHSLNWLFRQDHDGDGPLNYDEFFGSIGAVVMGSSTYEWVLRHEDGRWPFDLPAWVMTSRDLPKVDGDVRFARGDVRAVHDEMTAAAGGQDLWVVGGGDLAGQFADAGLLDQVIVYLAPVTLGGGAPLLPRKLDLRLEELARNRAFACARYTVVGPSADGVPDGISV
ncbi:dihydrofolate reductase family protein [Nitriliruptor alkaliphilus]|uniref:dihydrofolate reductase family protein n=1 Tax=Nitriliruptor alkaliphilus TaxID=427918 RepID=UPI000696842C|nr:dihydrofolate reductase family protein [Nitriliruptor alkaliphilus]